MLNGQASSRHFVITEGGRPAGTRVKRTDRVQTEQKTSRNKEDRDQEQRATTNFYYINYLVIHYCHVCHVFMYGWGSGRQRDIGTMA